MLRDAQAGDLWANAAEIVRLAEAARSGKAVRSELRTTSKAAVTAIGTDDLDAALVSAIRRIDTAAQKGVIHKNQAARRKSRLMRKLDDAG